MPSKPRLFQIWKKQFLRASSSVYLVSNSPYMNNETIKMPNPSIHDILKAHNLDAAQSPEWCMPLDVVDPGLPHDFNSSFAEGYAQGDPWLIHRALKLWSNSIQGDCVVFSPDARLFALPGYRGIDVSSTADLDRDDAKRVDTITTAAALWGLDLCFARLILRFYGPMPFSPGNAMGKGGRLQTVVESLFNLEPSADYEIELSRLHDAAGETILAEAQDGLSQSRLSFTLTPSLFIQRDFFGTGPDAQEILWERDTSAWYNWVRQTWTKDVSLPPAAIITPNRRPLGLHLAGFTSSANTPVLGPPPEWHRDKRVWRLRRLDCHTSHSRAGPHVTTTGDPESAEGPSSGSHRIAVPGHVVGTPPRTDD
jgi:hypothetical protein